MVGSVRRQSAKTWNCNSHSHSTPSLLVPSVLVPTSSESTPDEEERPGVRVSSETTADDDVDDDGDGGWVSAGSPGACGECWTVIWFTSESCSWSWLESSDISSEDVMTSISRGFKL